MSAAAAAHFPPLRPPPPPSSSISAAAHLSDSDATSSGDEDHGGPPTALEDSIFTAYLNSSGRSTPSDLAKIRSFLASSRRGSFAACLICLERIRPSDPTWSCSAACHALFHLLCIQSWGQQCSSLLPSSAPAAKLAMWHCPKCRTDYPKDRIPRKYLCYCGKVEDPPPDPWILPHSCGEVCGKPLEGSCGHHCLLLCHPGPCPPCPKLVNARCFCGSTQDVRRCAHKAFSCNNRCSRISACGAHRCPDKCHEGPCPPCRVKGTYWCQCGRMKEERECSQREFRCERTCDGVLGCGKHPCGQGCHSGGCGECPLQGKRTCPCGKKIYLGVSCDANVPNCGSTCEKMLSCNIHRCPERCHRGSCLETCRTIILKSCRCGSLKKEVPCHQELVCERKCQRSRDCGRHACKRRCCYGDCPPCPEICGRKLRCNNHKCPAPCHRGICAPCPLMVSISCFCGETQFEVPCGMEKDQMPPKCPKACHIPRLCRHSSESRKHKCHYGACPPCRKICNEEFPCGHTCKRRCHGPIPPANPEFTLKPKKKKPERPKEITPGSPCPPCQEVVLKFCLGQHIGEERSMLCSDKRRFSCQNLCGNLLHCGNHYCTKPCHALKNQMSGLSLDQNRNLSESDYVNRELAESCENCLLPCQKEREPKCQHPCPLPCHTDNCPPCKSLIKRSCHCGSLVHAFECIYFNTLSEKEQQQVRSCGGPCHRKLQNCPHLCSETCHPGQCSSSNHCSKKVTVRCACHTLKKVWLCKDVQEAYFDAGRDPKDIMKNQFGVGIIPCNSECKSKLRIDNMETLHRKTAVVENKVASDAEPGPRRRKRRGHVKEAHQDSKFQEMRVIAWKCVIIISIVMLFTATAYFGYKGVFWLSDWMNEIENRRLRKGIRRF